MTGIREINDKSDIEVDFEPIKNGRKFTSLKFYISYNIKNNFKGEVRG
jgi:Protein involved in initiation of plasmid replication